MKISSPELTALDLLHNTDVADGVDPVATVLADLGGRDGVYRLANNVPLELSRYVAH